MNACHACCHHVVRKFEPTLTTRDDEFETSEPLVNWCQSEPPFTATTAIAAAKTSAASAIAARRRPAVAAGRGARARAAATAPPATSSAPNTSPSCQRTCDGCPSDVTPASA